MVSKILMRHLARVLNNKVSKAQAKLVLLWHNNDIVSISVKHGHKRLCHIALGFLDHVHVDGYTFDLKEENSLRAIKGAINKQLESLPRH